ncbi:hypothetical protein GCM10012285_59070 [Streptomyces kronopolitis]|uniref:Uncharacterized protein n=1 Tax=Streptomyces kronopolitis TaxID=1612435 RepID=A0ABQ2K0X6_9ACTN|nr:hypothetical protein [Streptomyces kronopolitis]GGN60746.1 hypothetical protein GCM10012285_59070 [Streptomyces kronopolitis]
MNITGDEVANAAAAVRRPSKLNVGWIMPPFIHELPVSAADDETAAEQLYALVTEILPEHPAELQYRFALGISAQLEPMAAADVIYAGLCLLTVEQRPSLSTIVVSQVRHESEDDAALLRTTQGVLELKFPDDEYRTLELACGPALVRAGVSEFVIDADWSISGRELTVQQSQIQSYIPLPGTSEMLIFELSSPAGMDWELHTELFHEILNTIDWGTDQEVADYRSIRQSTSVALEADDSVKKELHWYSSRLLDALGVRGRMRGGGRVNPVTCQKCWDRGLRTPCSATHDWRMELPQQTDIVAALSRVANFSATLGWESEVSDGSTVIRSWEVGDEEKAGFRFALGVTEGTEQIASEVTSPCNRSLRASVTESTFG